MNKRWKNRLKKHPVAPPFNGLYLVWVQEFFLPDTSFEMIIILVRYTSKIKINLSQKC